MKRLLGVGKDKAPAPTLTDAVIGIESRSETIDKKISKLDAEIAKYRTEMARMCEGPSKNMIKQKALRCLKQKRVFENQREQLANQSFNLEQTNFAFQTVKDTKTTVAAMKSGVKSFKKEMKGINLTEIEDLYDDMVDINEDANELQEILGQPMGMPDIDEAELEAEFEALGAEMDFEHDSKYLDAALKVDRGSILSPSIPTDEPGSTSKAVKIDEFGLPLLGERQ